MGTRSRVGIAHGDVIKSVYCHYDGYLSYTGDILLRCFDSTQTNELVARGDNSGVKETMAMMQFYDQRGDTDFEWQVADSFDQFLQQVKGCGGEYYYVMKAGVWYAGCVYDTVGLVKNQLVPLAQALGDMLVEQAIAEDS